MELIQQVVVSCGGLSRPEAGNLGRQRQRLVDVLLVVGVVQADTSSRPPPANPARSVHGNSKGELTTNTARRPRGWRVKHRMKRNSIKLYDKGLCPPHRDHDRQSAVSAEDARLFAAALAGEHLINGFRNRDIAARLYPKPASGIESRRRCARVSRLIRKLRGHQLVAKSCGGMAYPVLLQFAALSRSPVGVSRGRD